ncbi:hypothetical protein PAP_09785 [Palaeococcus pacificus DY20341]|uniref:DUF7982 domain-containing protein n=1 Tax=Palaeococcus pacificus DY20341 TaxID=1343739 RepID=A0A075LWC1_9EURY|nr:hypothetical protein [Palaeococcus pacificus]AIF70332.1 hypothetical protein PAP_09785 [Palaeococcus pacificus DY20341]
MELKYEVKHITSAFLVLVGAFAGIFGAINGNQGLINLGLAGIFLGVIIFTFKSSGYIKKEALNNVMNSYNLLLEKMITDLGLEGNAVYIPPYENLPEGGLFVPLHEEFDLNLGKLSSDVVFLTNVSNERQMGLSLRPPGLELLKKYEEHLEYPLESTSYSEVEASSGSVLRALGLAKSVYIEEVEKGFRVVVQPDIECDPQSCEKVACPICSSILLGLAKATGELIHVESVEKKDYGIEIKAKRLGGVREWM